MLYKLTPPALFLLALAAPLPVLAGNGISGSAHDFSSESWNTAAEICVVCHSPHTKDPVTSSIGLLWNHSTSQASYTLYTSSSLNAIPGQPGPASVMCLACHDGTVAIDAHSGQAGSSFVTGSALIGTDLRSSHPVGIQFTHHQSPTSCGQCHNVFGGGQSLLESPLPFFDGKVECASCHNPHDNTPQNPGGTHMLRLPIAASQICFHCHDK